MTDYRELTPFKQKKVDEMLIDEVEPKKLSFYQNNVKNGTYCTECLMICYNYLCSYD